MHDMRGMLVGLHGVYQAVRRTQCAQLSEDGSKQPIEQQHSQGSINRLMGPGRMLSKRAVTHFGSWGLIFT